MMELSTIKFPLDHFFSGIWFDELKSKRFNGKFPDSHCWLCFGVSKWWVIVEPIGIPCMICSGCKGEPSEIRQAVILLWPPHTDNKCIPDGLEIRLVSYFEFSRYKSIYEVINT